MMLGSPGEGISGGVDELRRLSQRPSDPVGPLSTFYVEVGKWDEVEGFARRLRSIVAFGVDVAREADFDADELPEAGLPSWAVDHWQAGADRYSLHRGDSAWTVQDVLYSFDPTRRAWEWWDVTHSGGNILQVWIESGGEPIFSCEELRWIFYLCGSRTVVGPLLRPAAEWEQQASTGL
nr:hypothetical protein OG781_17040 [Streptomyces sp. NBC_00830]